MKRFDRAIKVLTDEKHRVIGRYAEKLANNNMDPDICTHEPDAKRLIEAIKILSDHPRNKWV